MKNFKERLRVLEAKFHSTSGHLTTEELCELGTLFDHRRALASAHILSIEDLESIINEKRRAELYNK